jgi:hypothetical protein
MVVERLQPLAGPDLNIPVRFGARVRAARTRQGLTLDDLALPITRRLFPWAPNDVAPWAALRWAAGRAALPDRPRLGPDWYWHCAPLSEWDGTITKRTAPPAWT